MENVNKVVVLQEPNWTKHSVPLFTFLLLDVSKTLQLFELDFILKGAWKWRIYIYTALLNEQIKYDELLLTRCALKEG